MGHLVATSLILLATASCAGVPIEAFDEPGHYPVTDSSDPSAELYSVDNLPRFDIELPTGSIESLEEEPRSWANATLVYRGEVIDNVAVRLKGEYSFRPLSEKPSFKIRFDKYDRTGHFRGLRGMTLNNNIQDPTMLSQVLGYRLHRNAGVVAPRATLATVFVNGDYKGVYTNVESEDRTFIGRYFGDDSGNLYEEGGLDFEPGTADTFDLETNEDADDRRDLEALILALDESTASSFLDRVGAEIDIESFLDFVAIEAIVGGLDGYGYGLDTRNNFRFYRDPQTQLFYFIPWGLDRALRPRFDPGLVHEFFEPPDMFPSIWGASGLLLVRCLEGQECREIFQRAIDDNLARLEALELGELGESISDRAAAAIAADSGMEADVEYVGYATDLMQEFIARRPESVRAEAR